jgi:hypothetical protein
MGPREFGARSTKRRTVPFGKESEPVLMSFCNVSSRAISTGDVLVAQNTLYFALAPAMLSQCPSSTTCTTPLPSASCPVTTRLGQDFGCSLLMLLAALMTLLPAVEMVLSSIVIRELANVVERCLRRKYRGGYHEGRPRHFHSFSTKGGRRTQLIRSYSLGLQARRSTSRKARGLRTL